MSLIDFILNLVGLLLWISFRAVQSGPLARPGVSLISTLKPAGPPRSRWVYLGFLLLLLLGRAFVYWQIGPSLPWNPCIPLGPTTITFRSDIFVRMLFFSVFSFAGTLAIFYYWLIILSCVNARVSDADPYQKLVRLHLGFIERWPDWFKLAIPLFLFAGLWFAFHPLLVQLRMVPSTTAWGLAGQGAIIAIIFYLTAKYLITGILFLHLLTSYVYIGEIPFWSYTSSTARTLSRPLQWIPLRFGRIDFSPVVGILLILAIDYGLRAGLIRAYTLLSH